MLRPFKKIIAVTALFSALFISSFCLADEPKPAVSGALVPDLTLTLPPQPELKWRLKDGAGKKIGLQFALLPVWFESGVVFHEGMHALACIAVKNCSVSKFYPFPGKLEASDGEDYFYYGITKFDYGENNPPHTTFEKNLLMGGPLIGDMSLFLLGDTLLSTVVKPDSRAAKWILVGAMILPLVDFTKNVTNTIPVSDLSVLRDNNKWSLDTMVLTGMLVSGVGIWRTVRHTKRIFFTKSPPSSKE